jgi:two-component system phosphate regulon response regulator PhoB
VLIADDDHDCRSVLQDVLAHRGYPTVAAADGESALMLARAVSPAVLVSELYLACGGCRCLAHAVRRDVRLRSLPVVAHTSFVFPADVDWAMRAPVDIFLCKPIAPREVAAVVERLVGPPFPAPPGPA